MTGGQYDIIGPDPRGTGTTMPVDCYNDDMERMVATLRTPTRTNSSDVALGATWSYTKQYAARCFQNEAVNGSLMSTAFVARDLMKVVDALTVEGEDGLLRYWGELKMMSGIRKDRLIDFRDIVWHVSRSSPGCYVSR